ncbi:Rrf2 family transcriptional regulator [Kiritimatiellaeota bacterium B1221]|nr:Rrf2 family transcriptional regulator [Kiritimatiellaeota bacterium B1221]
MIFSKRCLHALRAVLYVGTQPPERDYIPIREISTKLDIPFHFLTKILKDLADQGFIESSRGAAGGIRLAKPTAELNVKEIIESIEGEDYFSGCILGFSKCDAANPCALHDRWVAIKEEIQKMLGEEHLESLSTRIQEQGLRLLEM